MTQLTLYTNPRSRGRIARWMMEEVGQPYEAKVVNFGPEMNTPDYLLMSPMGKVPVLVHGGHVVSECAAICAYMADAFPETGLAPALGDRADYYRWMFFAAGPVEAAVTNRALGVVVPDDRSGMVGYGSYERTVATLEKAISAGPFICGPQFTAADVYVGAQVVWGLQFGSLPDSAPLKAYAERVTARAAYKRSVELSDADLPNEGRE
jgi:glutathione S-transferase